MAELEIVGARLSPFVEKVVGAAVYKQIPFVLHEPKSMGEMRKLNPVTGKMPVAFFGEEQIYDSTFILRRFDQLVPEPPLLSSDPQIAAAQRQLEDWSDEALYWYVMSLRWSPENQARSLEQLRPYVPGPLRWLAGPVLRRMIGGTTRAQGLGRLPYADLIRETGERLDDLVLLLAQRSFFYSSRPSVADFSLRGQFRTGCSGATPDFEQLVSQRPSLADWLKRVDDAAREPGVGPRSDDGPR
jgi:glutathione S-transferase